MLVLTPRANLEVVYAADRARYARSGRSALLERVDCAAFVRFFSGCPSVGFQRHGQDIGGLIFDGEQAHIAVLPEHHGHWGMLLKPALDWLFSLTPECLVEVERDNRACLRLMQHVGWQCVGERGDSFVFHLVPRPGTRRTAHPVRPRSAAAASPHRSATGASHAGLPC